VDLGVSTQAGAPGPGTAPDDEVRRRQTPAAAASEVIWHELECGSYRADLPLWQELAALHGDPILEIGAGTGRVSLALARAGHDVVALDLDPVLLDALRARTAGAAVETVRADARAFALARRDFGLCIVPMQTIQLLGGRAGRLAFLRCARAHLRDGGAIACAIACALEPFDCAHGDPAPPPDSMRVDGARYVSRPTGVRLLGRRVLIERERVILPGVAGRAQGALGTRSADTRTAEHSVIELDRVGTAQLHREAVHAGLRPEPAREIPATDEHTGSAVVVLRA